MFVPQLSAPSVVLHQLLEAVSGNADVLFQSPKLHHRDHLLFTQLDELTLVDHAVRHARQSHEDVTLHRPTARAERLLQFTSGKFVFHDHVTKGHSRHVLVGECDRFFEVDRIGEANLVERPHLVQGVRPRCPPVIDTSHLVAERGKGPSKLVQHPLHRRSRVGTGARGHMSTRVI